MVVFQCDGCGESVKKPKAEQHVNTCRYCRALVCLDCMKRFTDDSYKQHTSCISEAQKYQGALYKPPKGKQGGNQQQQQQKQQPKPKVEAAKRPREEEKKVEEKKEKVEKVEEKKPEPVEEEAVAAAEAPAKKAKKMHTSKALIAALVATMREARGEGETIDELRERAEKVLHRALNKAVTKLSNE